MRLALRLLRPAANQNISSPKLWQDPVFGYFETHGKTKFLAGEEYNLTDEQKKRYDCFQLAAALKLQNGLEAKGGMPLKAVLWRYRVKEILKKEYLRREYDPHNFKYKSGVVIDPAMFRWYAADMTQAEFFRFTPRSVFLYCGSVFLFFYLYCRLMYSSADKSAEKCLDGELLWWDRQQARMLTTCGSGHFAPTVGIDF